MIWLMRRLHETLRHSMGVGRGEADRMVEGSDGSGLGDDEMMDDGMEEGSLLVHHWFIHIMSYHARATTIIVVMLVMLSLSPSPAARRGPGMAGMAWHGLLEIA